MRKFGHSQRFNGAFPLRPKPGRSGNERMEFICERLGGSAR